LLNKIHIPACASVFNYFAGVAYHTFGEPSLYTTNFLNVSIRQAFSVVGLILPWNVPMIMFAFKVVPVAICDDTVVLKAIVFEDANITAASQRPHFSINHNSGQCCQANSRVLVHESVADDCIAQLKNDTAKVVVGDPFSKDVFQGPHAQRLIEARKRDTTLLCGRKWSDASGALLLVCAGEHCSGSIRPNGLDGSLLRALVDL
jgi:acyl-CoA reductase-like NAD-dependent aldehyde dehydrogenase